MNTFEFYRFRIHFRALDMVRFPAGKGSNAVRGAFGLLVRNIAPEACERLFDARPEPPAASPSGLAEWPRPLLFRAAHLDGLTIPPGANFAFDAHAFDVRQPVLPYLRSAFASVAEAGIGASRGRASICCIEQLDLEGRAETVDQQPLPPCVISLDPDCEPSFRVRLQFQTPTELKVGSALAPRPEFPILFARLRDRLSTLRALYGSGPLAIDFRALGERSRAIRLERCDLVWERVARRSSRTGQVHPIGGFTGEAEYAGALAEFLPFLRAARWVGVGRQTVWGKGDVRVLP